MNFFSLIILLLLMSALPYGTVEPWWEASLVAAIFLIGIVAVCIDAFRGEPLFRSRKITLPLIALGVFALLQSFELPPFVSLDSEATRLVAYQIFSFAIYIELIHRSCADRRRLKILVWSVIGLGIATSLFGILRILAFDGSGEFFLDGLKPGVGFAQFINQNHFAMLASASAGVAFAMVLGERSKQKKLILLAAFLVPMAALVFSLSRGAIFAFVIQTAAVVLIYVSGRGSRESLESLESLESRRHESPRRGRKRVAQGDGEAGALGKVPQYFKSPEGATETNQDPQSDPTSQSNHESESHEIDSRHRREHDHRNPPRVRLVTRIAQFAIGIAMFLSIIYGISWIGNEKLAMRIEKLPDQTQVTDADRGLDRLNAWKGTWELFKEYPIFGSGFGAFKNGITRHIEYSGQMRWEQAHNDYLEFLAAVGLVGIVLGLWFLVRIFKLAISNLKADGRRTRTLRYASIIGIVGIAVHSIVDFGLHTIVNSMVLMILIGVMTATVENETRSGTD